jgi:hypothetical protein
MTLETERLDKHRRQARILYGPASYAGVDLALHGRTPV